MKPSVSLSAGPTDGVVWCSVLSLPNNLTGLNVPAHDTLLVLSLTSVATLQRDTMTRNTWNIWRSRRGSDLAEAAAKCDLSDLFCDYMNSERDEERFTDQVCVSEWSVWSDDGSHVPRLVQVWPGFNVDCTNSRFCNFFHLCFCWLLHECLNPLVISWIRLPVQWAAFN